MDNLKHGSTKSDRARSRRTIRTGQGKLSHEKSVPNRNFENDARSLSSSPQLVPHRTTPRSKNAKTKDSRTCQLEALYPTTAKLGAVQLMMDQSGDDPNHDLVDFLYHQRKLDGPSVPVTDSLPDPPSREDRPTQRQPEQSDRYNARISSPHVRTSASAALVPLDQSSTLQSLIVENDELREKIEELKKELKDKDMEMQSLKLETTMREAEVGWLCFCQEMNIRF